jgi:hypothetical protein
MAAEVIFIQSFFHVGQSPRTGVLHSVKTETLAGEEKQNAHSQTKNPATNQNTLHLLPMGNYSL